MTLSNAPITAAQVQLFRRCFRGLEHVYGTYDATTRRVWQVKQPVTDAVVRAHLEGRQPFGVYLLVGDRTHALVIDFDIPDLTGPLGFLAAARRYGIACLLERSKSKGHHVWVLSDDAGVSAAKGRLVAQHILDEIGQARTEVFPKQDRLDHRASFGNFINTPLFGALVPTGRCVFLNPQDPTRLASDPWGLLETVARVSAQQLDGLIARHNWSPSSPSTALPVVRAESGMRPAYGLPACAVRMLAEGVDRNQRVACFRLATHLRRIGLSRDAAIAVLAHWSTRNRPENGKGRIRRAEIEEQTNGAYRGHYTSCGCEEPVVQAFCDSTCPVRRRPPRATPVDPPVTNNAADENAPPTAVGCGDDERSTPVSQPFPAGLLARFRANTLCVEIWENQREQNGQPASWRSVRIRKRYRNQTGVWSDTQCYFAEDLPRLQLLLAKAYERLVLREECRPADTECEPATLSQGAQDEQPPGASAR